MVDDATRACRFSEHLTDNERLHATLACELFVRGDIDAALAAGELLVERPAAPRRAPARRPRPPAEVTMRPGSAVAAAM